MLAGRDECQQEQPLNEEKEASEKLRSTPEHTILSAVSEWHGPRHSLCNFLRGRGNSQGAADPQRSK